MKKFSTGLAQFFYPFGIFSAIWSILATINFFILIPQSIIGYFRAPVLSIIWVLFFITFNFLLRHYLSPVWKTINKQQLLPFIFSSLIISATIVNYSKLYLLANQLENHVWFNGLIFWINLTLIILILFLLFAQIQQKIKNDSKKNPFQNLFGFFGKSHIWQTILFILMCIVVGYLQIGNFNGRLATIPGDDAPIVYSNYFLHPERYTNDILATYGSQQIFVTIQNLLPAVLFRYLSISPAIPTLILVYAQFILLGLSIRRLTKILTGKEIFGWLTVLFIFSADPWNWNLANYGNAMYIPYAGHLVMPFIFYSFSDVLEGKNLRAMLWLFIGGLIHPTLVLYAIGMIAIYWIINFRYMKRIIPWVLLVLVAFSAVLPRFLVSYLFSTGDLLTFGEMLDALLVNQHMTPMSVNLREILFVRFLPLIFLALRELKNSAKHYGNLLIAVVIGCLILVITSWIGWKYQILPIIQFIPQRSSIIFTFISLPLVLSYFYNNLINKSFFVKTASFLLFILFLWKFDRADSILTKPEYWIWIAILLVSDILSGDFGPFHWRKNKQIELHENLNISTSNNTIIIVVILFIGLLGFTFRDSWLIGETARSEESLAAYDIQVWARENTPEDSLIIDMGRAVSQRASVSTIPYNWFVYNRSRECKAYLDRYDVFYEPYMNDKITEIKQITLNEEGVLKFAAEFKADYIVRNDYIPLDLEEVYRNDAYILYKIPSS